MESGIVGQHALVCGATHGIGHAIAHELALAGATVTVLAREEARINEVVAGLPKDAGQHHHGIAVDMEDTDVLARKVQVLTRASPPISILVHNSGGPAPGLAHEAPIEAFEQAFRRHLYAYQTLVQALVPGMKERRSGRIINVISTSVKQPLPNLGVSNTLRGAVANWAKTLANELGPHGITVNNVLPGATRTDRLEQIIQRNALQRGITPQEAEERMVREIPVGRFARPEEVAYAVVFLAGPSAASINGINLPVDGGRTGCL
ncbi:MAG: SDR family oxidoreductase [Flavobacteriales bacterium]|nr:SDR family oxidoreductase [Flavobacteriales bacterium]MCB9193490.1 SDR family oxidoreductase [Flavobacteriales bacterium]